MIYKLYGSEALTPAEVRELLEREAGWEFREHDSMYLGGLYYRAGGLVGEHFELTGNEPDDEGDRLEPDYSSFQSLLRANEVSEPEQLHALLSKLGLVLLESETG